jgi:hypothetical protein
MHRTRLRFRPSGIFVSAAIAFRGTIAILGFLAALSGGASYARDTLPVVLADCRLLESRADGVRFSFAPDNWKIDTLADGSVAVSFAGAQWSTVPGARAYPERSVLVAVPPDGDVSVIESATEWQPVASRPAGRLPGGNAAGAVALGRDTDQTPPLVRWDRPFWIRDLRVVRIWLAPVQPAGNGLSAASRIDVQVRWTGRAAASARAAGADAVFSNIYGHILINPDQAQSFAALRVRGAIDNPFAPSGEWYRIQVTVDGPQRITKIALAAAGFPVDASDPRSYRLFYAGGGTLPVPNSTARPALREIPITVTGAADGRFDASDTIYFFGQAASRWNNSSGNPAIYETNPYTRETTYWLTPGGSWGPAPLRMGTSASLPGADPAINVGIGRAVAEQDKLLNLDNDDFYTWYWQKSSTLSALLNLPGAVSGAGSVAVTTLNTFGPGNSQVSVNGQAAVYASAAGRRAVFTASQWLPNTTVQLSYLSGQTWMDRVEAIYPRALDLSPGAAEFWLPAGSGNRAALRGFTPGMVLWDLTRADSPFVVGGAVNADTLAFDPQAASMERRFRAFAPSQATAPVQITRADPGDLRQNPPSADMLIIAHPSLLGPLDAYRTYREQESGISVELVDVERIYDDFGFGQFDPVAIRDFLKYTYENAAIRPSAALLVGDGSYDFLNHLATGVSNQVPPFIVSPVYDNTAGDQNYVSFGSLGTLDSDTSRVKLGDRGWDMISARWPVRNAAEVQVLIDKLENYETAPEFGLWRNRVVMIADDEFGEPPSAGEYFHTEQAEEILTHVPPRFDTRKIYLFEYRFDATREKPQAREALVSAWNEGMLMVDYVGHGSPNVWAHEDVFRRSQDVPRLFNGKRLPLVYTASCSIGQFDDPLSQGMGEELMRRSAGGAIAVISAMRLVFSQPNVDLNEAVLDFLMGPEPLPVGAALFAALVARQYTVPSGPVAIENDRKHLLFCDPFLKLATAGLGVQFDSAGVPDSLVALTPARVSGQIVDAGGQPVSPGGVMLLSVRDAPRARQYQVGAKTVTYNLEGRPIFAGSFPATSADFDLSFFVPKDVSYGSDGARIVLYDEGTTQDALGVIAPIPVASGGGVTDDVTGPAWSLLINGEAPAGGRRLVSPTDDWRATISDPLGINIGGGGHGISVTVDGDEFNQIDLTPLFGYDVGSFSTGKVAFKLPDLEPGEHDIRLLAWDNANNPGAITVAVTATGATDFEVRDFLVYPNPFRPERDGTTRLTYDLTFPPDRVELSVLTVAGNKIRTLREAAPSAGFNYGTAWDGRDDVGDPVAAGVYLVALEARGLGRSVKEFTKIVVVRSE